MLEVSKNHSNGKESAISVVFDVTSEIWEDQNVENKEKNIIDEFCEDPESWQIMQTQAANPMTRGALLRMRTYHKFCVCDHLFTLMNDSVHFYVQHSDKRNS